MSAPAAERRPLLLIDRDGNQQSDIATSPRTGLGRRPHAVAPQDQPLVGAAITSSRGDVCMRVRPGWREVCLGCLRQHRRISAQHIGSARSAVGAQKRTEQRQRHRLVGGGVFGE